MTDTPATSYARTAEGIAIAYQVLGDGPYDLVYTPGYASNVDANWLIPSYADFLRGLASIARLLLFDRRGSGCSDRELAPDALAYEAGMEDIGTVMDAAGSSRAVLLGFEDGAMLSALYAASHPERVAGLVMFAPWAASRLSPDYPWGYTEDGVAEWEQHVVDRWGTEACAEWALTVNAPGDVFEPALVRAWARQFRSFASPASIRQLEDAQRDIDLRWVLPSVQVPTLVLRRQGDPLAPEEECRYIAGLVPGAEYADVPGTQHPPFIGDPDPIVAVVQRFGDSIGEEEALFGRALATVLFTDIVRSTERAAALGDREWADLLQQHHHVVRTMLARYRGTEVDTAGDGFFATFDGPARAIRCAQETIRALEPLGIEIRAGLHTGEVSTIDGKAGGMAVTIGARIGALAAPSEVLVSHTVKDLVAGSGLSFAERGEAELKGVPDPWRLYTAT